MNQASDTSKRSEEIRSEIDQTRQRMDSTIDAIGARLQGRHLLDEILGFFRSKVDDGTTTRMKEKLSSSTSTAVNSVVETVKAHPLPILAIGAGIAWLIYDSKQKGLRGERAYQSHRDFELSSYDAHEEYFAGEYGQGELPSEGYTLEGQPPGGAAGEKWQNVKSRVTGKAAEVKDRVQEKAAQIGERAKAGVQRVGERARELGSRVGDSTRQAYDRSKERVVQTADSHPVELGLGLLALGLIAGLAIPTPRKVDEMVGPQAERLRRRAKEAGEDLLNRGKTVANAAASALREEAQAQGLTAEALRQKAGAVADRAKEAASNTARQEGITPENVTRSASSGMAPQNSTPSL